MRKILVLDNGSASVYNFRFELVKELISNNYEVIISTPEPNTDNHVAKLICAGAKHSQTYIDRRGVNPIKDSKLLRDYRNLIKELNPDVILTYTIKANLYGTFAASTLKKPTIINITGLGSAFSNWKLRWLVKKLYKYAFSKANFVFVQNQSNYSFLTETKLVNKNKIKVIPGSGVNTTKFSPNIKEHENKTETIKFLFIGRIMKEKGIEEYLEVAKETIKEYSNVQFFILGRFEEEKYVEVFRALNQDKIVYLGTSTDVRGEIQKVDCIINPSYHEGMSNVLLEAAAMGKPLIASNIPGCMEIVQDGYNGYLFNVKSVSSLKDKIVQFILKTSEDKEKMGQNSRIKVETQFDRSIVIKEYFNAIGNIVKERN